MRMVPSRGYTGPRLGRLHRGDIVAAQANYDFKDVVREVDIARVKGAFLLYMPLLVASFRQRTDWCIICACCKEWWKEQRKSA